MPDQTAAERQIDRAKDLERQRGALMELIAANRDYLRLMDKNDELTEEQGDWLDVFYPTKEKGEQRTKDEVEATRKAKEEARKGEPAAKPAAKAVAKAAAKEPAKA